MSDGTSVRVRLLVSILALAAGVAAVTLVLVLLATTIG
jgi:hypothetical protein